ncbi:DUF4118 domain-containing protein [Catenulispora subtropica]|uniref:Sensor protein KdpD transmembrane domain-containing protein n=1 Tax=Catenulispora subtropica TaxID=450798 RepID=A0ABP5C8S3_9ACTN
MRTFSRVHRDRLATAAALLLPLAVAAALLPWRSSVPNTDMALLLVVTVVAVAADGNRTAGILAAISAAVWFDFFWTVPYERFTITRHTDIETTVLLLAVGAAVSELAARGRRARRVVVRDTAYLHAMRSTSAMVADGRDTREVVEQVQAQLVALLGLRAARFEQGRLIGRPPRLTDDGALVWGQVRWNIDEHGFPDEDVELLARSAGRTRGRFLLTPLAGSAPSLEARQVAVMLANHVGNALAHDTDRRGSEQPA